MVPTNDEVCPYCRDAGKCSRLVIVQSTWKSAIVLCSDPLCIYPLDKALHCVERDWNQLERGKNDSDKDILAKAVADMKLGSETSSVNNSLERNQKRTDNSSKLSPIIDEKDDDVTLELKKADSKPSTHDSDDDELNDLLDYLGNLPNNAFTTFSELPTSTVIGILQQQNEILKVLTLPAIVLPDESLLRTSNFLDHNDGLSSLEYYQSSNNLGPSIDKLGPRRYPQWSEEKENNLSWLTSGIALVVHSRLVRCVLKSSIQMLSGSFPDDISDKDSVSMLCGIYEMAMRKFLVGVSLCTKDSDDVIGNRSSGDSGSGYETSSGNSNVISYGSPSNSFRIPRPIHQRIICHLSSCRNRVRQQMITSKSLANHPADVLAFLLSSNDNLKDLCAVSYKTTVDCSECQQRSVSLQASRAVTLELPPSLSNFSMIGPQCCASMSCGLCGVPNQIAVIEWQTLSPLLFLHFPVGLPESCNFEKFRLELDAVNVSKEQIAGLERYGIASRGKYELRVTAVIAVDYNVNISKGSDYVTWVRRGNDFWMACREAYGHGSCISEWDPLTSPRTATVRRCDVRILFFEAQSLSNTSMHKSASTGFLDMRRPPSLLHQRYLSIMRQRRKELQAAATSIPSAPVVSLGSAPLNKKNIMQRFLYSDLEHKALLEASRTRFEPYSAEVKSPPSSKSEPSSPSPTVKRESFPSQSGSTTSRQRHSLQPVNNTSGKRISNRYYEVTALSLWPSQKRRRVSDASSVVQMGTKEETSALNIPETSTSQNTTPAFVEVTNPTLFEGLSVKDSEALQ